MKQRAICIIALGDIGHCPRMQNHAVMFASTHPNHKVKLIGYNGSDVSEEVKSKQNISVKRIWQFPRIPIFLLYALLRIILDCIQLLFILFTTLRTDLIVIQVRILLESAMRPTDVYRISCKMSQKNKADD